MNRKAIRAGSDKICADGGNSSSGFQNGLSHIQTHGRDQGMSRRMPTRICTVSVLVMVKGPLDLYKIESRGVWLLPASVVGYGTLLVN